MYTKIDFGKELKEQVRQKTEIAHIGCWVYSIYSKHMLEIALKLRDLLLTLAMLELGPEFERSYEELDSIAESLIAGEDVQL